MLVVAGSHGDMPTMTTPPTRTPIVRPPARRRGRPDRSGATRRDDARARVRWISRAAAIVAAGTAAVLGLVVSKEIPGTTASATASSSGASQTATADVGSSSSTTATTSATTAPTRTAAATTPSSTTKSATVVSGGTGS